MAIRSKLSALREYLTPVNNKSNFSKTGEISPEEFVKAGDYLVYKFPTWEWSAAPDKLSRDFLPKDKQFLVTRHVPSYQRAYTYLGINSALDEDEEELDDGWVKSHKLSSTNGKTATASGGQSDIDELVEGTAEIGLEENENEELDEEFEDISDTNGLRKYDLYITYSTSYRVPKLYLVGFNANGIPLLPKQMFEDISSDYRDKTATIESLPVSSNTTSVSIHPCKHSSVMKVLMKHAIESNRRKRELETPNDNVENQENSSDAVEEEDQGIRVDQYLIIFLKFIASVTPGIEYDYTMEGL